MRDVRIAPSVLAGDLSNLRGAVEIATQGSADQVHLDVIDGHFAPNITFGAGTIKALRRFSDLPFDVHLMISEPSKYVDRFLDAGSDILTFHAEVLGAEKFDELYSSVHARGRKLGLAIKPSTYLPSWARDGLDKLDVIIVMTVDPGFSGQNFNRAVLPKIEATNEMLREADKEIDLEVDGGIEPENAREVVKRGANVLVAGAGVYAKPDPVAAIGILRDRATHD